MESRRHVHPAVGKVHLVRKLIHYERVVFGSTYDCNGDSAAVERICSLYFTLHYSEMRVFMGFVRVLKIV